MNTETKPSKKPIIIIISVTVILLVAIQLILHSFNSTPEKKAESIPLFQPFDSESLLENQLEKEKNTPSEIEGMSLYDKRMNGLSPYSEDTDGDGLSDKEELEVYGTNPHEASTSGDLYSDGYKVKNNIDVNSYTERVVGYEDFIHAATFPQEIYPNPADVDSIEELNAFFMTQNPTDLDSLLSKKVYAAYEMLYFGGAVAIDISDIIPENDNDIEILYIGNDDLEEVSFVSNENMIAFDTRQKGDGIYAICSKKNVSTKANKTDIKTANGFWDRFKKDEDEPDAPVWEIGFDGEPKFIVAQWQLLNNLLCQRPTVYYVSSGDEEYDEQYIATISYPIDDMFGNEFNAVGLGAFDPDNKDKRHLKRENFEKISYSEYLIKKASYDEARKKLPFFVHDYSRFKEDDDECYIAFGYMNDNDLAVALDPKNTTPEVLDHIKKPMMGKDTLPFPNFGSYISEGGNCAGFAALTATLYNTGSFPEKGEYSSDLLPNEHISYDLTTDEENKTLMDRFLYDYKDFSFTRLHTNVDKDVLDNSTLSEGENQFVNMIGMYWAKVNDAIDEAIHNGTNPIIYQDKYEVYDYGYEEFLPVDLFEQLEEDKMYVLTFNAFNADGEECAHAVNIIESKWDFRLYYSHVDENGVRQKSDTPCGGILRLKIYDNNYPDETREAIVNVSPSRSNIDESVCTLTYDLGGGYKTIKNNYRQYISIMDESLEPIAYTPVVEIGKIVVGEDGKAKFDYDGMEENLEDYLKTYPDRRFEKDKEKYK